MTDTRAAVSGPLQSGPSEPGPTPSGSTRAETSSGRSTGRTRISGTWVVIVAAAVVLALLLVFILQNTKSVKVSYFTANGMMPLGVALLLAAVGGVLLAGVVGSLRIWQLRRRLTVSDQSARHRRGAGHGARASKAVSHGGG